MSAWSHLWSDRGSTGTHDEDGIGPGGAAQRSRLVLFDGACGMCQRSIVVLRRLDLRRRLQFADIERDWRDLSARYPYLDRESCLDQMHVISGGGQVHQGFDAYRSLAWVLPPAWVLLPLLYVPGVPAAGRRIYRFVAARRKRAACTLPPVRTAGRSPHRG